MGPTHTINIEEKMINKTSLFKDWTNLRFGKRTLNFPKKVSSITKNQPLTFLLDICLCI